MPRRFTTRTRAMHELLAIVLAFCLSPHAGAWLALDCPWNSSDARQSVTYWASTPPCGPSVLSRPSFSVHSSAAVSRCRGRASLAIPSIHSVNDRAALIVVGCLLEATLVQAGDESCPPVAARAPPRGTSFSN